MKNERNERHCSKFYSSNSQTIPFLYETKLIKFQQSETETKALHSGTHGPIYHRRSLFHLGQILRQDLLLMGLQSGLWLTQERHTYQKKKSSKPMHVVQGIRICMYVVSRCSRYSRLGTM